VWRGAAPKPRDQAMDGKAARNAVDFVRQAVVGGRHGLQGTQSLRADFLSGRRKKNGRWRIRCGV
jgi:hypothetical protein